MATGACGINCDVCRLKLLDLCSSCGSGKGPEAEKKITAQIRILGSPCPILACARGKGVEYCLRDCRDFPCGHFSSGPYPFSEGYLKMQERRRREYPASKSPLGDAVKVPARYWEELEQKDPKKICENDPATACCSNGLILNFLGKEILVDRTDHCLKRLKYGIWERIEYPLLELLFLVYLLKVGPNPLSRKMISVQDLKDSIFFQGPHELKIRPLIDRFGYDLDGFRRASESLGGVALNLADAAYKIPTFPKVPLYYLLWEGNQEFEPRLSILFDRSIEDHLSADAIWGLVNLVSDALLRAPDMPF